MSYGNPLRELAQRYRIATAYTSNTGDDVPASDETLLALLQAMDVELPAHPTDEDFHREIKLFDEREASRPLPRAVVGQEGHEHGFVVHVHDGAEANVWIELEDGSTRPTYQDENFNPPVTVDGVTWGEASFHVPGDLPRGYHRIKMTSPSLNDGAEIETALIITPARLNTTERYLHNRTFGVMAQLYSVRSEDSWGIGDFHDLGALAETLAQTIGADFLQVNPLHAAQPFPPVEDSPYLPTTRRFINPLYLRVEDVPEFQLVDDETREAILAAATELKQLNRSADYLERDPIYAAKLDSLREIFAFEPTPEREKAFTAFVSEEGQGLIDFAQWCAEQEMTIVHSGNRHSLVPDNEELVVFYMWLQFLCDEQLSKAQKRALDAGMSIGIMTDLAVGVHPGGADAHTMAQWIAPLASVGAPPDPYNQQGQDWSQPPWNPWALAEAQYQPWRAMLETVLRHSGGIRVDHILGLFRLFWMPRSLPPSAGTYVHYDHEAMVGILALEAERAQAVVIGEDLGTFEPWVQDVLGHRGILGTSVLWFESMPDYETTRPKAPEEYRHLSMSSVGTHDLPPTAGYLAGEHIFLRERLGLLHTDAEVEDQEDLAWQAKVLNAISQRGFFDGTALAGANFSELPRDERGDIGDLLVGLHRYIASSASALTITNLVDLVGDVRVQNQPGTNATQYPNWRVPLCDENGKAVLIEDLANLELVRRVGEASRRPASQ